MVIWVPLSPCGRADKGGGVVTVNGDVPRLGVLPSAHLPNACGVPTAPSPLSALPQGERGTPIAGVEGMERASFTS